MGGSDRAWTNSSSETRSTSSTRTVFFVNILLWMRTRIIYAYMYGRYTDSRNGRTSLRRKKYTCGIGIMRSSAAANLSRATSRGHDHVSSLSRQRFRNQRSLHNHPISFLLAFDSATPGLCSSLSGPYFSFVLNWSNSVLGYGAMAKGVFSSLKGVDAFGKVCCVR